MSARVPSFVAFSLLGGALAIGCAEQVGAPEEDGVFQNAEDGMADGSSTPTTPGSYRLYFTNPMQALVDRGDFDKTDPAVTALASRSVANGAAPDTHVVALMDQATGPHCSLLVADYDFNLQSVADAMVRAKRRGCDVRLVTDGDIVDQSEPDPARPNRTAPFKPEYEMPFKTLRAAGIEIRDDGSRGAIMHDKFVVVNHTIVWMGSWNMAIDDTQGFWNNAFQVSSATMADRYTAVFEALWQRFDPIHPVRNPHTFNHDVMLGSRAAQVFFPSEDHATNAIVAAIKSAQHSIHFLAFSFTSQPIGDAMRERAAHGVSVVGVFESYSACAGQYHQMPAGIDVVRWSHDHHHYMHEKVIIIDGRTVVFGSFNFSSNADQGNDENTMIITDTTLASRFEQNFALVNAASRLGRQPAACP